MGTWDGRVEPGEGIEQCNYAMVGLGLYRGDMRHTFFKHSYFIVRCRGKTSVMRFVVHMSCIMNRGTERS